MNRSRVDDFVASIMLVICGAIMMGVVVAHLGC